MASNISRTNTTNAQHYQQQRRNNSKLLYNNSVQDYNNIADENLIFSEEMVADYEAMELCFGIYEASLTLIALLAVAINAYLIYIFVRWVRNEHPNAWLLASLTLNDFLAGSIVIPLQLLTGLRVVEPIGSGTILYVMSESVNTFSMYSTIYNISVVSLDRYLLICHPIRHKTWMTGRVVTYLLAGVWFGALTMTFIPFIWRNDVKHVYFEDTIFDIVSMVISLVIPMLQMSLAFPQMIYVMHRWNKRIINVCRHRHLEFRASVLFLCTYLIFIISWSPIHIVRLMIDFSYPFDGLTNTHFEVFVLLRYISAIINPTMYTLRTYTFTKAFESAGFCLFLLGKRKTDDSKYQSENCIKKHSSASGLETVAYNYSQQEATTVMEKGAVSSQV